MTTVIDAFTDEQVEFSALAAKVFAASAASPGEELAGLRAELAAIGLPLLAVPEDSGGVGGTEPDVVLILEAAGYADVPVPIAETVGIVAPMLARYGTARQRETWLPALGGGDCLATTVCRNGGLGSRRGAQLALAEHDGRVHLLELGAGAQPGPARWGSAVPAAGSALADPAASVTELRTRAAWVTAAQLNGVARRLLDLSVDYARAREQFGVPIGSFQAVKHMLADMAAGIEAARPVAWRAARALAGEDPTSALVAAAAKALAAEAGALANDNALQIHAGIGFTREHPLHRWLLYGHELETRWGSAATHLAAVGRRALDAGSLIDTFVP
jgi:alkylation response protein AidB-like acyl-CoA dehydrogenase